MFGIGLCRNSPYSVPPAPCVCIVSVGKEDTVGKYTAGFSRADILTVRAIRMFSPPADHWHPNADADGMRLG